MANRLARFHAPQQPLNHLLSALRSAQIAELDARNLASSANDIEPDDLTGLQVDQRSIIQLRRAADVGRAKADDAPRRAEYAEHDAPSRGDLVLRMKEERIIVPRLGAEPHCIVADGPVEPVAVLGRQIIPEIFVDDDGLIDRGIEPLDVGQLLLGYAG